MPDMESESVDDGSQDFKALYEAEQAKNAALATDYDKRGADLSSLRGTVRSQTDRDAAIDSQISGLAEQMKLIGKAQESGETEGLTESMTRISDKSQEGTEARKYQVRYESLYTEFQAAVQGEDGKPVLDLNKAPELADARALWMQAYESKTLSSGDRYDLYQQAIRKAEKVTGTKLKTTIPEKDKPESEDEDKDDPGTDTGPGATSIKSSSLKTLMGKDPSKMKPSELKDYTAELWKAAGKEVGVTYRPID